ncbi:MAG TPA: sugar phosphate isomerase/epimerase family protein [Candidatus Dormibacteraeota bacterium]
MTLNLERLSLNQVTVNRWSLAEAVDGCARHGLRWIGLWRDRVAEHGLQASARRVRDAGVGVSSLCRGGFFSNADAYDDNRRAIDEAAALGAPVLVLVSGPAPDGDLQAARRRVCEGVAELLPYAQQAGVQLGLEPLHPMFAGDRSVVVTLAEALAVPDVGVVVDVYHVWWDLAVHEQIRRAGARICGLHVSDWLVPPPDHLLGRGLMGDGVIRIRKLRQEVDAAGYDGPIEVEIFNQALWNMPGDDALELLKVRFAEHV